MSINHLSARIKRLLTANVHALVSSLEERNPAALLEQYLREFDEVIAQTRVELGQQEAAKHQATRAIARFNNDSEKLTEQIDIALKSNDEAAARAGVEKQLDLEAQIQTLNTSLQDIIIKAEATETDLLNLCSKRDEMMKAFQEMQVAQANAEKSNAGFTAGDSASAANKADALAQGFNRTLSKASGIMGLSGSSSADPQQLRKLEAMQREQRITERLARLKAGQQDEKA